MLSTEELLKPRIKFIAPYPNSNKHFKELGEIGVMVGSVNYEFPSGFYISKLYADTLTANFVQLPWYAERDIKDMPEYVLSRIGYVSKVNKYDLERNEIIADGALFTLSIFLEHKTPATLEQYNTYINQLNASK